MVPPVKDLSLINVQNDAQIRNVEQSIPKQIVGVESGLPFRKSLSTVKSIFIYKLLVKTKKLTVNIQKGKQTLQVDVSLQIDA